RGGPRLGDLLRPAARLELRDDGRLRVDLRLRLGELRHEAAGLEPGDDVALLDAVALLDEDIGDAAVVVEGDRHLAHLDVAVEDEVAGLAAAAVQPPPGAATSGEQQNDRNCNE